MKDREPKINVLAVIDELIDFSENDSEHEPSVNEDARKARAIVAELLLIVESYRLAYSLPLTQDAKNKCRQALFAAISKIKQP